MTRVFITLGSNINPEYNMQELPSARCRLLAVSPVYETAPVGKTDQPNFLNAAALIETDLTAAELKTQVLQVIERELGRVRSEDKNAPRTIDLDIALFGDQGLDVGPRHIPDPDIFKYPHIAVPPTPTNEIWPRNSVTLRPARLYKRLPRACPEQGRRACQPGGWCVVLSLSKGVVSTLCPGPKHLQIRKGKRK